MEFEIAGRKIGSGYAPFIIAEMSGNHNQSLELALKTVEAAAKSGAHALKIQTYTADTMTIDLKEREFLITDPKSLWNGYSLYQLYEKAHTPWEWHALIFDLCKKLGVICFSTPFDETAVDFLETLNVPCYKIASFENTDLPLIRKVAATGKPLIISTGMASLAELHETVAAAKESGCKNLVLLKCTSNYPASPLDSNLITIPEMQKLFGVQIGLSDHTLGIGAAVASVAFGATVIEKHFTINRADGGVDSAFSLEPAEMGALVTESERAWQSIGQVRIGASEKEKSSLVFRRSVYFVKALKAGEKITMQHVRAIRPGLGLPPKFLAGLIGKTAKVDIARGTAAKWDLISD